MNHATTNTTTTTTTTTIPTNITSNTNNTTSLNKVSNNNNNNNSINTNVNGNGNGLTRDASCIIQNANTLLDQITSIITNEESKQEQRRNEHPHDKQRPAKKRKLTCSKELTLELAATWMKKK